MAEDDKIASNPSSRELSSALPAVRVARNLANFALAMGLGGEKAQQIVDSADNLLAQSDILDLPDRFNTAFMDRGWFATSSLSVEVMREALKQHGNGDADGAEATILSWLTPEIINLFAITRSKQFSKISGRWDQLREASALTEEGRYWAAVPLILIACDGFASDVLGTSPFEKNADLSLFDSVVGHPTALPAAIARLTKGVRKSSDEALSLPLRHGILHGRSLGYANRLVCGKAWMLMIALVDWAADKRQEDARRAKDASRQSVDWSDLATSVRKSSADKAAIDEFSSLTWHAPFDADLRAGEPPLAFRDFLTGWKAKNFGLMARRAVNITKQSHSALAGRMRSDVELVELIDFEMVRVEQQTVARAEALVRMQGRSRGVEVSGNFIVLAFRQTPAGDVAMPTDEGDWHVQQGCIFDLMHERTADKQNGN